MEDEQEIIIEHEIENEETTTIEPVIYTGPNIFPLRLQKFRVFRGELPPYVKKAIEAIPEIESLIVPVSELETMRAKIEKSGTLEARIFYTVTKEAEKLRTKGKVKK